MSMNLCCNLIKLRQTPTQITNMCLVQNDGTIAGELEGKKASHAIQIYKQWVKYCRNGVVFQDPEDLEELLAFDKKHLVEIDSIINHKGLKVWIV